MSPPFGRVHRVFSATPTIDTNIYASGDLLGTKLSFSGAGQRGDGVAAGGIVRSVLITDLAAQGADIDVVLFNADPSGTTFTNNAAFDLADADIAKVVGVAQVTTDAAFNDNGVSFAHNLYIPFNVAAGNILYGALVVRATPTYATAADLVVYVGVEMD